MSRAMSGGFVFMLYSLVYLFVYFCDGYSCEKHSIKLSAFFPGLEAVQTKHWEPDSGPLDYESSGREIWDSL